MSDGKMSFGIVGQEELATVYVDPSVFREEWQGNGYSPERELAATMLAAAAEDLQKCRFTESFKRQARYWVTYKWVASNDREWSFSFLNLADYCHISASALRRELLHGDTSKWTSFGINAGRPRTQMKAA